MTDAQKPHPLTSYLFSFFLSACMSGIVSGIVTFRHVSLADGAVGMWMSSWLSSFIVAFPTVLVVAPLVRRLAEAITGRLPRPAARN
jgi:hypothetical protein